MTIPYKKLWIMLAEREMSKAELRRQAGRKKRGMSNFYWTAKDVKCC